MKKSFKIMFIIIMFAILLSVFKTFTYADVVSDFNLSERTKPYITELTSVAIVLTIVCTVVLMTAAILFFNLKLAEKVQNTKVGNTDKIGTDDVNKKPADLKKPMCICGFIIVISVVILVIATHV